jgi:hypothetical protein
MLTVVAVTGAGAATGFGPDLGALEDALESIAFFNEQGAETEPDVKVLGEEEVPRVPGVPELRLSPLDRSEVIEFPWSGSDEPGYALAFAGGPGELCYSSATPSSRAQPPNSYVTFACEAIEAVLSRIGAQDFSPAGFSWSPTVVIGGYVGSEVEQIAIDGPSGALQVALTAPWRPPLRGAKELRVFVAVDRTSTRESLSLQDERQRIAPENYKLQLTLIDGRTLDRTLRGGS